MPVVMLAGTGKIATAIAQLLASTALPEDSLTLMIVGRTPGHAEQVLTEAQAIADSFDKPMTGVTHVVDWSDPKSISPVLHKSSPDLIVQLASEQPPSGLKGDDEWSKLVSAAGFGITLPLHLPPLRAVCEAMDAVGRRVPVLNACFPDLMNVVATRLGWPVVGGFGNLGSVALLAQTRAKHLKTARFVGCHHHLARFLDGKLDVDWLPRCFIDRREMPAEELLGLLRSIPKPGDISSLTAATAVPMIRALSGLDERWEGAVSGPLGRVGGYPACILSKRLELDMRGLDLVELEDWNIRQESGDGVTIRNAIEFMPAATAHIRAHLPGFEPSWAIDDRSIQQLIDTFRQLKSDLQPDPA